MGFAIQADALPPSQLRQSRTIESRHKHDRKAMEIQDGQLKTKALPHNPKNIASIIRITPLVLAILPDIYVPKVVRI